MIPFCALPFGPRGGGVVRHTAGRHRPV